MNFIRTFITSKCNIVSIVDLLFHNYPNNDEKLNIFGREKKKVVRSDDFSKILRIQNNGA